MEQKIVLVAETGSDITPELAEEYGIFLVPMHVSMGDQTLDDGAFPPEDVCAYYNATGKVPQTSASMRPAGLRFPLSRLRLPSHEQGRPPR